MSLAGVRSNRGDAYQRAIALHQVVMMLIGTDIAGIEVDAVSLPQYSERIDGDDIVIIYNDDKKQFLQVKVNQSKHQKWKMTDTVFKKELNSAKLQLLADPTCEFHFYSRTPFGAFQRLVEECHLYFDYPAFEKIAPQGQKDTLAALAQIWQVETVLALSLVKRILIGDHHNTERWLALSLTMLKGHFSQPEIALRLLYAEVGKQHSKLGVPKLLLARKDLLDMLEEHGIYYALSFNELELARQFHTFSQQGRQCVRTIGGVKIPRPELDQLKSAINQNEKSVLLEDIAGGGKTCILLDLVDYLEQQANVVCLFIKGDMFASINSLADLTVEGLPQDLVAQCAYLATKKKLVVIIDSLDVLAVGRSHKSLRCFLGLIAQLAKVPNVTAIAASRSFDAKFDPLLRETDWSGKIMIKSLSYDRDIVPLLASWGVAVSDLSESMRQLLIIPQNSRLLYSLVRNGELPPQIEAHDLFEQYIQQIVEKDEMLGMGVLTELQDLAAELLTKRSYQFARQRPNCSEQQLHRLLSQEVLSEVNSHQLMFSHQTLADALRIRRAQKNGVDLISFVTPQPQLPFIRPAVRSFILYLRMAQPQAFIKQLRQFLLADTIAIHLKRLAVESLAEMQATANDLPLLIMLFNRLPNLFNRFLDKANSDAWFQLISRQWLDKVNLAATEHNASNVLLYLTKHMAGQEQQLLDIWHRAFDEQWLSIDRLVWRASIDVAKFTQWDVTGTKALLVKFFDAPADTRRDIGKAICRYVDATGDGDELLWRYIVSNTAPLSTIKKGRELSFYVNDYELLGKDYFENRLKQSAPFFGLAMDFLLSLFDIFESAKNYDFHFEDSLLHCCSYQRQHTQYDAYPHDSIHTFLYAIEAALICRAQVDDECWRIYEPKLRTSRDLSIRYMLCQSYMVNIEKNIVGIEYQLTDAILLRYGNLEYELGVLAKKAYPYISATAQTNHQRALMGLYDDVDQDCQWVEDAIYDRLIWVPGFFRLDELNGFMTKCEQKYGKELPAPRIHAWGGMGQSPISHDTLLAMSDIDRLRLLQHYNQYNGYMEHADGRSIGDRRSLLSALSTVASWVPMKFLSLVAEIKTANLAVDYIYSIIDGFSIHLSSRFGNVSNAGWQEVVPLPHGQALARIVLDLVERYCSKDIRGYTTSRAIQACSHVLNDESSLKRIYFHLWRLGGHQNPEPEEDNSGMGLRDQGFNSVRGTAAESVLIICHDRLAKKKLPLSAELIALLFRYSKDPSMAVRTMVLDRLPYLHSKIPDLGWELLHLLAKNAHSGLPTYFERTLYYQYHQHFELVKPFLNTMKSANDEQSAQAWGRLATLAHLAGHLTEDELWAGATECHAAALAGLGEVFIANLEHAKSSSVCVKGLSRLMAENRTPETVFSSFAGELVRRAKLKFIPLAVIQLFIEKYPADHIRAIAGIGMFYWLECNVLSQPEKVLALLEAIVSRLQGKSSDVYFHQPEILLSILKVLLQEADLTDDNKFIDRVLIVQDWFMERTDYELDNMFDNLGSD